jgi:hypothetical protein
LGAWPSLQPQQPQPQPQPRVCPGGLLAHLPQVYRELLAVRRLTPLRLLVRGPPASGARAPPAWQGWLHWGACDWCRPPDAHTPPPTSPVPHV